MGFISSPLWQIRIGRRCSEDLFWGGPKLWERGFRISTCCISLLPPCCQRHHSCREALPSLHIPVSHQLLSNFCSNTRKGRLLKILLVCFLVCYYFPFKYSPVTEIQALVERLHWQNENAMQKPGGNGWKERRRRKKDVLPSFGYIHLTALLHSYIYIYVHRGHLEDLVYYYYHIMALLVRSVTEVSFQMGEDENAKSFLWRLFHAWRAAKGMAAKWEWEMESERMPGTLSG